MRVLAGGWAGGLCVYECVCAGRRVGREGCFSMSVRCMCVFVCVCVCWPAGGREGGLFLNECVLYVCVCVCAGRREGGRVVSL